MTHMVNAARREDSAKEVAVSSRLTSVHAADSLLNASRASLIQNTFFESQLLRFKILFLNLGPLQSTIPHLSVDISTEIQACVYSPVSSKAMPSNQEWPVPFSRIL